MIFGFSREAESPAWIERGASLALLAAVLFGLSAPFAKGLLRDAEPQLLAGLLYLGSGAGLAAAWLFRRRRRGEASLSRHDLPWLASAIAAGGILGPLLLLLGLERTPASSASLLLNLEGVFTALFAWFLFQENFDRRIALGMLAIVAGGAVISWDGRVAWGGMTGPLLIAAACLCWAIDNNLTQRVSASDPVQIAMLKGITAGAVNTGLAVWLGAAWPGTGRVGAALLLGFLSYGLSLVLFVLALRHLGTARTGAYFSVAPFVGAAVAILGFGERPTALFVVGAALMLLGVWLHLTERHLHEHTHHALEHEHAHVHDEHHRHAHRPEDPPGEPHTHPHRHEPLTHTHRHYPDVHHRHPH
ncbi:MAG TPA: EamA family transporter [Gemmatimonadales bacterium]|nr:EamA family transporter [Gemmatimonadales bacterium]